MELEGRHVVVTGGAAGIGRAIAQRFARAGARAVVVADIDAVGACAVAAEIDRERPGTTLTVPCDVAEPAAVESLIDVTERQFGPIDLFCANAGIGGGAGLAETTEAQWDRAFAVNVRSHVVAARRLVPGWAQRGEGYFLATASAAGLLSVIGSAPYAVSKHAAVGFAEWLAITYSGHGIRVSCLCPMAVDTKLLTEGLEQPGEAGLGLRLVTLAGPVLDPQDVAEAVLEGVRAERFLILPHPEVHAMYTHKAADHDAWIKAMAQAATAERRQAVG